MTEGDTPSSSSSSSSGTPSSSRPGSRFTFQSPSRTAWSPTDPNRPALFPPLPTPTMATATAAPSVTLTNDQLQALVVGLNQATQLATPAIQKPRVGGVNAVGAWTGEGAQGLGLHPKSGLCMRQFKASELKGYQALLSIEEKCKGGLQAKGDFVFGLPGEKHHDKGALLLRELDELLTDARMEGVFHVVLPDGTMIDMLKQPGFVTKEMVETWIKDLTVDGVRDGNGGRHPVCPFDLTNIQYSFHTIINSCTPLLRQDLLDSLSPVAHTGPQVLASLCKKVYPSSYVKIKSLIARLESKDIRKYPGENITTFVQEASQDVHEIMMNSLDLIKSRT